jgi:hypothetical protein
MGDAKSVRSSTATQQDHVLPVSERWEILSQCVVLQLSSRITYNLWMDDGWYRDRISA